MNNRDLEAIISSGVAILRVIAPIDTGNLRYNAIKMKSLGEGKWKIYIDEKVAPYMVYTNEPWKKGKNPHEYWFDDAARFLAWYINGRLNGTIKRRENNGRFCIN